VAADGSGGNNWSGVAATADVAVAVSETYAALVGYPIEATNHTKVMQFEGTISNTFDTTSYTNPANYKDNIYIDTMLQAGQVDYDLTPEDVDSGAQLAMYVNTNGHVCVFHAYYATNENNELESLVRTWSELEHDPIASDQWVRVTIKLDYINPPGEGYAEENFFQVQIDGGAPITHARAFTSTAPVDGSDYGGSWFLTANSGFGTTPNEYLSAVELRGRGKVDDLVVTDQEVVFGAAYDITVVAGAGGRIEPAGPIVRVAEGADKTFLIIPNANYTIDDVLVNDSSIGVVTEHTFTNVMANQKIEARFRSSRTPLEQWLDSWGLTDPDGDEDGDGMSNREEYYAGTIPTGPEGSNSVFEVVAQRADPGANTVWWYSTTNSGVMTGFVIYRTTDLVAGNWEPRGTNDVRQNGTNYWVDINPPPTGPAYYQPRIVVNP
jgi:hypothetical protein